ncbi:Ni/Co efflux regulator RcnB [Variovorax sp. TBS-050B]|uniref:RcnB family protein n=1 Tax=Variovorax sp. TBS-050B TaxID=2940551 RepID=UPI002476DB18|nr:RcnB family protein [Variovorax sp. TBS-050B]MDH6592110.1 Ni/Co efflux regulator RcnB [Variovorax sp. TBS-050B]
MIVNSKRIAAVAAAALAMCMAAGSAFAQDRGHGGHDRGDGHGHGRYEQRDRDRDHHRYEHRRGRGWDRDDDRPGRHFDRRGYPQPHAEWRRGGRVPHEYRGRNYVVNDWRAYHLQPPPRGYQWVGVGGDYVLAAIATGLIAQIIVGNQ